jgi:hypothetical protein
MTIIVNLFGGPGSGKSTTATGVFSALKQQDISCEYVNEFAKEVVWEDTTQLLNNQIFIFAEQLRRQLRLVGKVDYVITDSPILLSCVYFDYWKTKDKFFTSVYKEKTLRYFLETFLQFKNVNWIINRNKPYQQAGRIQTLKEAEKVDADIRHWLDYHMFEYQVTDSQRSIDDVTSAILEKHGKREPLQT